MHFSLIFGSFVPAEILDFSVYLAHYFVAPSSSVLFHRILVASGARSSLKPLPTKGAFLILEDIAVLREQA